MIYAVMMLMALASLIALGRGSVVGVPLFVVTLVVIAVAFVSDITVPMTIGL